MRNFLSKKKGRGSRFYLFLPLPAIAAVSILILATGASGATAISDTATNAVPTRDGTLNVRSRGTPDCLDPQKTASGTSFRLFDPVLDTLVRVTPRGKYIGYLAESWTIAKNGLAMTFKMRKGLRFSNGNVLDARDVKFTFDRARDPATNSPVAGPELLGVTRVVVVNPLTVRLVLSAPSRPLLANLAEAYLGIIDQQALEAEGDAGFCQQPVGSGPFKITSVGPAFSTVVMERNPYHHLAWGKNSGTAYLKKIVWTKIEDEAAAASALLSGQIDLAGSVASQYSRLAGQSNLKVFRFPTTSQQWLGFNVSRPPFDNREIRRAVASVIDRAALVRAAVGGLGSVAWSPVPLLMPFYSKDAKKFAAPYDPAAAKRVLAGRNLTVDLLIGAQVSSNPPLGQLVQAWLADAGVKVNIIPKDNAGYLPVAQNGGTNMWLNGWGCSDPDCLRGFFAKENIGPGGSNFSRVDDPTLNAYFEQGRTATTAAAAAAAYAKVQDRINDQAYVVPLYDSVNMYAMKTTVFGYTVTPLNDVIWQDVWVKK